MHTIKVIYILNNAPNYRNVILEELGKYVDLTVVSFSGKRSNLKDPEIRKGYKYVELQEKMLLGVSLQLNEFFALNGNYDVYILGFDIHRPFRFLNLFRKGRVIFAGLIYGSRENSIITRFARKNLLSLAEGVLVYSDFVKNKLSYEIQKPIISFNNTSFRKKEIKKTPFTFGRDELNLLWVGRYQKRKEIERLVSLARRDKRVNLRLIGPGISENLLLNKNDTNIETYSEIYGGELLNHFEWSHAVFNPGHAGLLIMNAGRFGRPIFIDNGGYHAPEIQLAIDASQIFLDFGDDKEVDRLVNRCIADRDLLIEKGTILADIMKDKYTIEHMAQQYLKAIKGDWEE